MSELFSLTKPDVVPSQSYLFLMESPEIIGAESLFLSNADEPDLLWFAVEQKGCFGVRGYGIVAQDQGIGYRDIIGAAAGRPVFGHNPSGID